MHTFDERFPALFGEAYRSAYRVLGRRAPAEDIAAEALTRCLCRWGKVENYAEPWVSRVSMNLAIDQYRRERRWGREPAGSPSSPDTSASADVRVDLIVGLLKLPRRQRESVALHFLADLSLAEVATVLGITAGSVKQHIRRGLASLRADSAAWRESTDVDPVSAS